MQRCRGSLTQVLSKISAWRMVQGLVTKSKGSKGRCCCCCRGCRCKSGSPGARECEIRPGWKFLHYARPYWITSLRQSVQFSVVRFFSGNSAKIGKIKSQKRAKSKTSKLTLTFGFYCIFINKSFDKSGKPNYFSNFYFFQSAMSKFKFCNLHRDDKHFFPNKQLKALFLTKEPKMCQKLTSVPNNFLWSQDIFKRAKKCQIFLKVPNQNFWCQTDLKRARFVNSGSKKSQITTLVHFARILVVSGQAKASRSEKCQLHAFQTSKRKKVENQSRNH